MVDVQEPLLNRTESGHIVDEDFTPLIESCEVDVLLGALAEIPTDITPGSALDAQVSRICACIQTIHEEAFPNAGIGAISAPGGLELCLSVLLRHTKDERIIHSALLVLGYLVANDAGDIQGRIGDLKGPQLIIRSLISMRASKRIQLEGCKILLDLTPNTTNRDIMGQFFAIEVALSSMRVFIADENVVTTACAFVANIGYRSLKNKDLIIKSGGVKAILRAFKRNKTSKELHMWGLLALRNLSIDSPTNQIALVEAGIVRTILTAILQFKESDRLANHAVAVLFQLADGTQPHNAAAALQIANLRGIEIIVRTMRAYRSVSDLHLCGVGCMRALVGHSERNAHLVLAGGGLEAVLSSMIAYRTFEELQWEGIRLIDCLCVLGGPVKQRILAVGGLGTISISLKTHLTNRSMIEIGAQILLKLREREDDNK